MMKLARVRACVLYDATYDDATEPESSGGNTRVRFTFHPSIRSAIISSQLAACNLQLGRPRTQIAMEMCVVYLILESVAALAI